MTSEPSRPRLGPDRADIRRAVRVQLEGLGAAAPAGGLVLVALSGGADSLALASAVAHETTRASEGSAAWSAGAIVIDHGLQDGSAQVAERAAEQARAMGLNPIEVVRVEVEARGAGVEGDARDARYSALEAARVRLGARAVFLGHTMDDQAETVLLGLARGSGASSLSGMRAVRGAFVRPLLGIRRAQTEAACREESLDFWVDPHNSDQSFARVRVRQNVLPTLESELGPGITEALARTADQLAEDAEVLTELSAQLVASLESSTEPSRSETASVPVAPLAEAPAALRQRALRTLITTHIGVAPTRAHTLAVGRLVTDWHGQERVEVEGGFVTRADGMLQFHAGMPPESAGLGD